MLATTRTRAAKVVREGPSKEVLRMTGTLLSGGRAPAALMNQPALGEGRGRQ